MWSNMRKVYIRITHLIFSFPLYFAKFLFPLGTSLAGDMALWIYTACRRESSLEQDRGQYTYEEEDRFLFQL